MTFCAASTMRAHTRTTTSTNWGSRCRMRGSATSTPKTGICTIPGNDCPPELNGGWWPQGPSRSPPQANEVDEKSCQIMSKEKATVVFEPAASSVSAFLAAAFKRRNGTTSLLMGSRCSRHTPPLPRCHGRAPSPQWHQHHHNWSTGTARLLQKPYHRAWLPHPQGQSHHVAMPAVQF